MNLSELNRQLDNPTEGMLITRVRSNEDQIVFGGVWKLLGPGRVEGTWKYGREIPLHHRDNLPLGVMNPKDTDQACFSANPDHIHQARESQRQAKAKREQERKQSAEKLKELETELSKLLKSYGAELSPVQLSGDDQGVEISIELSLNGVGRMIQLD